jgi:hypothetical protein
MAVTRSTLAGGPAHITYGGATAHLAADSKVDIVPSNEVIKSSMYGNVDEAAADLILRCTGQPLTYENLSVWFPYLTLVLGQIYPTGTDTPLVYLSNNGDVVTVRSAVITKMPDIVLGVADPILGDIEFAGIIGDGMDPETANSYYTLTTGQTYVAPSLDKTKIPRQKYTAAWGTVTGFTSFQALDKWTISWELDLQAVKVQGRTVAYKLMAIRALAKCIPVGPTASQIDAALKYQGTGATHGHKIGGTGVDLVITGTGVSVTIKNAALKTAGFVFGAQTLRNGEIGFVSTVTGTQTVVAVIA